jgi:hypothetical protein
VEGQQQRVKEWILSWRGGKCWVCTSLNNGEIRLVGNRDARIYKQTDITQRHDTDTKTSHIDTDVVTWTWWVKSTPSRPFFLLQTFTKMMRQ